MDSTILFALVAVLLAFLAMRAVQLWPTYKGSIFEELFSSYLEYFWRMRFLHDLSVSSYLGRCIGNHKIVYNSVLGKNEAHLAEFVTVFSEHGFLSICSVPLKGDVISSKGKGAWKVETPEGIRKIKSPAAMIDQQRAFLESALGTDVQVSYLIAFGNGSTFKHVSSSIPVMTYQEAGVHLMQMREGGIGPEDVQAAFEAFRKAAEQ
jgi:hypothetical protein